MQFALGRKVAELSDLLFCDPHKTQVAFTPHHVLYIIFGVGIFFLQIAGVGTEWILQISGVHVRGGLPNG